MLEDLRFYCIYLALLAGIVGLLFYNKLPGNKAKSLLGMIFFSVLTEFVGSNLTRWTGWINYGVYNFYMLVSLSYYLLLLKYLLVQRSHRRLVDVFLAVFILFYFANFIFIQKNISETFTYSFTLGVLFVLLMSCLYLVEIFNSKKILNFSKSVFFWFILGVLLLHVPYLPFMLAIKWFLIESNESVYSLVLFILNVLMYGCFIIGFIWSEKKYNY
ncbi:hypothetical protein CLV50_2004 [Flavobacterium lindanitolerans]|jgi:hypothetical protein|uniref:Uncharacterized protein n=2 Tax=Flavobacteriaceae TaxID=49546 RepID=A0A497UIC8_9FLAO|nr:hypothetical protein ASG38_02350 [Flavobacterium sp. Leaf359]OJX54793.1 MAG: hypothetical protein BGO88_02635 [Flavobacterium sp. 38-13]PKW20769.1 hypothetical protein B0G92_2046 [Flavobacterium lindanitolerans]PZQ79928.1 MAG: hypothetical protein DI548_14420 [Flavobacterium johnsoniae]RLJ30591.1 hypothetical protein CLV50_2004 [Flavobacterium lindanitolerans]